MSVVVRGIDQGTPEWQRLRQGIVTASNFHRVMTGSTLKKSASQRGYLAELLVEHYTPEDIPDVATDDMQRGVELEDDARAWYEFETGFHVEQCAFVYGNSSALWGCSPDGLVSEDGGLEIKVPRTSTHLGYHLAAAGVPATYVPQVYGALYCTGRQWWDFLSYVPGGWKPYLVRVTADDSDYKKWAGSFGPILRDFLDELIVKRREFNPNKWASAA